MNTIEPIREAFRFHQGMSGWVGGHAIAGIHAARAEAELRKAVEAGTARIRWEHDDEISPEDTYDDPRDVKAVRDGKVILWSCILERKAEPCATCGRGGDWEVAGSLGAIGLYANAGPDTRHPDPYVRSVEADLAIEAGFGARPS